ncbi:MAG: N-carbamoylputrescine amidase [Pseudomonadales bacterium]
MTERNVTVAATQMACSGNFEDNLSAAEMMVRRAAKAGANIILLQELFTSPYFCKDQAERYFDLAEPVEDSVVIARMRGLAKALGVVLPVSFFEVERNVYYNALVVIDADGEIVSHYRKSHIPDGPGYQEKFYFAPGDTGFVISETQFGTLGVGICWDQWFPEVARALVLQGAEMLLYPTAIGSEPVSGLDSRAHWRRTMQGHAAANMVPLIASNRIGEERGETCTLSFYGSSFIADPTGDILIQADDVQEALLIQTFDLDAIRKQRTGWGLFRDRRPDLYQSILTLSGRDIDS